MIPMHLRRQGGFTIVELMVGILVGLLVVMAATGGAAFYEANRRSTMGSNGAQENATAAAFHVQKLARMAGSWSTAAFACPTGTISKWSAATSAYSSVYIDPTTSGVTPIEIPVQVLAGSSTSNTDSIGLQFAYAEGFNGSPDATLTAAKTSSTEFNLSVTNNDSISTRFNMGDIVLLAPPVGTSDVECTLGVVTQNSSALQLRPYGNSSGTNSDEVFNVVTKSRLFNLGSSLTHTLTLANNKFLVDDAVVAENVVKLMARYESNTSGTGLTTASWPPATDSTLANSQSYVLSVIVVGRSPQMEKHQKTDKNDTSTACNATTTETLPKDWNGNAITIQNANDATRADGVWQCYRYKAIQVQVPLKNLILQAKN